MYTETSTRDYAAPNTTPRAQSAPYQSTVPRDQSLHIEARGGGGGDESIQSEETTATTTESAQSQPSTQSSLQQRFARVIPCFFSAPHEDALLNVCLP